MAYEPFDLEEAVRITLRGASDYGTWDVYWWDHAPPGWTKRVRVAPQELLMKVHIDLRAIDKQIVADWEHDNRLIEWALDVMTNADNGDEVAAMLREKYPDSEITADLLRRYEKEHVA